MHVCITSGSTWMSSLNTTWPKNVTCSNQNSHFENLAYNWCSLKVRSTYLNAWHTLPRFSNTPEYHQLMISWPEINFREHQAPWSLIRLIINKREGILILPNNQNSIHQGTYTFWFHNYANLGQISKPSNRLSTYHKF